MPVSIGNSTLIFRALKDAGVRIISADMAGSWVPGMTEEECEMHQSELSECSRGLAKAQEMLEKSGGKDPAARAARDTYVHRVDHARRQNDPGVFKRWEYERRQLKVLEARANGVGCVGKDKKSSLWARVIRPKFPANR